MAFDLRTDEIIGAFRTLLGTSITVGSNVGAINSKPEGNPLFWVAQAKYPTCVIVPNSVDFIHEPKTTKSVYSFSIFYCMDMTDKDAEFPNPYELARKRAEILLGRLEASQTLGLSYIQDSYPMAFMAGNEINELFLDNEQHRVAVQIDYAVEIAQARS